MPTIIRDTLYSKCDTGAYEASYGMQKFRLAQSGIAPGKYYSEEEYEHAKATTATDTDLAALRQLLKGDKDWQQQLYDKREKEIRKLRYDVQRIAGLRASLQMKCYEYTRIGELLGRARKRNRNYHRLVKSLKDEIARLNAS